VAVWEARNKTLIMLGTPVHYGQTVSAHYVQTVWVHYGQTAWLHYGQSVSTAGAYTRPQLNLSRFGHTSRHPPV
jgi:hypothetical protein